MGTIEACRVQNAHTCSAFDCSPKVITTDFKNQESNYSARYLETFLWKKIGKMMDCSSFRQSLISILGYVIIYQFNNKLSKTESVRS